MSQRFLAEKDEINELSDQIEIDNQKLLGEDLGTKVTAPNLLQE